MKKEQRRSSIELLRILAACMVVISHLSALLLNPKTGILPPKNNTLITILLSCSVCAVDVFIVISGFFLWNSKKRTIGKAINLLVLMAVINMSSYFVQLLAGSLSFSLTKLLHYCFAPSYFVTLYIVLYLISPYINIILNKLTPKGWSKFFIFIFVIFSIYGIAADVVSEFTPVLGISPFSRTGSQNGYNIVTFVLLYCMGAFLNARRLWIEKISSKLITIVMILCILAIWGWSTIGPSLPNYANSARSYHNPFVILMAMSLLVLFNRMSFSSRIINCFAKAAFTVYLIHPHFFTFLHVGFHMMMPPVLFMLWMLSSIVLIYIVSWLFWILYDFVTRSVYKRMDKIAIPYGFDDVEKVSHE